MLKLILFYVRRYVIYSTVEAVNWPRGAAFIEASTFKFAVALRVKRVKLRAYVSTYILTHTMYGHARAAKRTAVSPLLELTTSTGCMW